MTDEHTCSLENVVELDTLKLILDYAVDQGLLLTNHAAKIKRRKVVTKDIQVPTRDQFKEIINCMRDENNEFGTQGKGRNGADLIELLAYSGCRLNEAVELKWKHVDFEAGSIKVDGGEAGTKNHEFRKVPMSEALRKLLLRIKEKSKVSGNDPVASIRDAKRSLKRACRILDCNEYTHHDFRHFFATTCIESMVDIATISRWLGHKDGGALAMKVYGHLRDEHSQKMIQQVKF